MLRAAVQAYTRVADAVQAQRHGSSIKLTFANTEARPKLQLRWKNGNPPDVDYVFNSADRTSLQGKYYMVPDEAVVMGLFYNGKVFDQLGLRPPATWDELVTTCGKIRAKAATVLMVRGCRAK